MARKQYEVVISANGKVAEKVLEGLRAEASKFKEEMENLEKAGKKQTAEFVRAEKAYESLNSAVEKAEKGMKKLEEVLDDLAGSTTKELRGALRQTKGIIDSLSANDPRRERFVNDFKKIKEQIDKNNQSLKDSSKEIDENSNALGKNAASWKDVVKGISVYSIAAKALDFVKGKIGSVVRGNFELSDSMAAVRKVTGMTADEVATLTTRLSKMDTRTTLADLNAIAEAGGRMGLAKYGIQGMEQFVKAANQIQVALGDDLGNSIDESILPLAKLGENLGLFEKMGVDKAMLAIGSSINELGATSTAQGANIVDFARRIQASAQLARVSASDILALGSAVDAAGITSEVGASSFQKFFAAIRTNTGAIEKALDIPKGKIDELYNANRTMDATILILQKMKEKGGMRELGDIFKLLGSKGSQMTATFSAMANNVDILSEHLRVSREAFGEQISITNEFNSVQETAQGYLERAQNLWQNAFVNPEGVDVVKDLAVEFYNLSKEMTSSESTMQSIKTSLGMVAGAAKILLQMLPALIRLLMFYGVVDGIKKIGVEFVEMKNAIGGATGAMNKLGAVIKANAFALVASVVLTVATSIYDMAKASKDAAASLDVFAQAEKDAAESSARERGELERLYRTTQDTTKSIEQRTAAVAEMQKKYPAYFGNLTTEEILAGKAADAYARLKTEILNAARARAYQKKMDELAEQNQKLEDQIEDNQTWMDENRERYSREKQKADAAVNAQNRLETAGASAVGGKMGYVRASNNADKAIIGGYQARERQNSAAEEQIKANNAKMDKLADKIDQYKPKGTGSGNGPTFNPLENDAPDKAAAAAARKAALEEKKEMRQQLQESEAEAKAIVDNIKNFYERQITETLNIATATGMNPELQDQLVNSLTMRMNSALAQARKAVAGTKNDWEAFKLTIQDDMIEPLVDGTNESMQLLDKIENNNLAALRRQIAALSKSLNKPESALIDQVWKNATLNEKANAKIENKEEQRRRQAILEKNFTGKVNQDTETTMEQFGFAMLTPEQMKIIMKGGQEAQQFLDERSREWQVMLANARENFSMVATTDNPADLFGILFGQDWESHKDEMKLRGLLDLTGEDFQLFYDELIKYNDAYVEAQKRAAERVVKINDYVFESRFDVKAIDDEVRDLDRLSKQQGREGGRFRDMQQRMGIADTMANDPELLRLALIEERERKHLEMMQQLLEQEKITMKEYNAALEKYDSARAAHADKVAQSVSERIALLQQLTHPIEDFGTAVGDAFATMTTDAEEGRKALQDAVKSMIEQFGKMTIKMYAELMTQKMQQALFHQEMEAEDRRHSAAQTAEEEGGKKRVSVIKAIGALILGQKKKQKKQELKIEQQAQGEQTDVVEEEGESRLSVTNVVETGIASITAKAAQDITQTKQSQAATNAATTAAETEGSVAAGVAGGAAKIIGTLGWWGIPLIAVITALLNGLLAFALGKLFGGSKSQNSSSSATNVKLKSGMLTYDGGNIHSLRSVNGGSAAVHTVLGTDGRVYQARDEGTIQTGIVRSPITASVNGQPSIIGERGPELVVGRETTRAIMLSRPDILKTIADIDRNRSGRAFRTLDDGDLSALTAGGSVSSDSIAANNETMQQLAKTVAMLSQTLTAIQQRGIPAHINKYGRGGLIDEVQSGMKFMQKYQ